MELMFSGLTGLFLGGLTDLTLDRYVSRQSDNIEKIVKYYNQNYFPIKMENPLVRMLSQFTNYGIEESPLGYYNRTSSLIEQLCLPLGIANSINPGFPHIGSFYGDDTTCQFVYSDFITISTILRSNWKKLSPVRVMRRDGVRDPMRRPDLIEKGDGLVIIEVDMATLAYMYKCWVDEQLSKPIDERLNDYNFLGRIVYPNMINSGMFATYVHAIHREDFDINAGEFATNLSIIDYSYRLIRQLRLLLDKYKDRATQTSQILEAIPLFDKDDGDKTAIDGIPEIRDRDTTSNAYITFLISFPLSSVCLNNTLSSPMRQTVMNDKAKAIRYFRNQRASSKISDKTLKKIYQDNFKEYEQL